MMSQTHRREKKRERPTRMEEMGWCFWRWETPTKWILDFEIDKEIHEQHRDQKQNVNNLSSKSNGS
jgi:hypothetical protein